MSIQKKYTVTLCNGKVENLTADQVTYDDVGNLMFLNFKQGIQTPQNPEGKTIELVKCYNARHYESYSHAPIQVQH